MSLNKMIPPHTPTKVSDNVFNTCLYLLVAVWRWSDIDYPIRVGTMSAFQLWHYSVNGLQLSHKVSFPSEGKKAKTWFLRSQRRRTIFKNWFFFFKTGYFNFKATLEECFKDIFNSRIFKSRIDLIYIEP